MADKESKPTELKKLEYWIAKDDKYDNDSPCYYCGANGIFIKKKTKIFEALVPAPEGHQEIKSLIKLTIPKMPMKVLMEVVGFFKAVQDEHDSEAIVILLYDKEWAFHVPKQEVSGAAVDYNIRDEEGLITKNIIGTIHSHNTMSAFHSITDDNDEETFDGIHITIGKLDETPEFACSVVVHGQRVKVELKDIVEVVPDTKFMGKVSKKIYKSPAYQISSCSDYGFTNEYNMYDSGVYESSEGYWYEGKFYAWDKQEQRYAVTKYKDKEKESNKKWRVAA